MAATETLSASLEDYLEAIFHITRQKRAARAKDISRRLKVSSSSVTGALHALAERELVNYAPYDIITLSEKGIAVAEDVVHRHEVICDFIMKVLSVGQTEADEAACKMEHSIQPALLERFIQFVKFVDACPRLGLKWIEGFGYHCIDGIKEEYCEKCTLMAPAETKKIERKAGEKITRATSGKTVEKTC